MFLHFQKKKQSTVFPFEFKQKNKKKRKESLIAAVDMARRISFFPKYCTLIKIQYIFSKYFNKNCSTCFWDTSLKKYSQNHIFYSIDALSNILKAESSACNVKFERFTPFLPWFGTSPISLSLLIPFILSLTELILLLLKCFISGKKLCAIYHKM